MHRPLLAMVKLLLVREWYMNQLDRNQAFRYRTIFVVLGVLLSIFLVIVLLVALASDDPWWKSFRETIRDSAGFLTLIGALVTAGILVWTNRARMREAASADFVTRCSGRQNMLVMQKDRMSNFLRCCLLTDMESSRLNGFLQSIGV